MRIGMVMMAMVVFAMMMVMMMMIMPVMVIMVIMVIMTVTIMPGLARAGALDMVMVALLRRADFRLEAEHLGAELAHLAVHRRFAGHDLLDPFDESVDHRR